MKKLLLLLVTLALFSPSVIRAADLTVHCSDSSCTVFGLSPLFSSSTDGFWYPGRYLTKTFQIANDSALPQQIGLQANQTDSASILENVITISIVDSAAHVIYLGSLHDFYQHDTVYLADLSPSSSADFTLAASMETAAGNDYQHLSTVFNLDLGFISRESEITPTPSPVTNPESGIFLNEIFPSPSDENQEWVELYNNNAYEVNLVNWQFDDLVSGGGTPKTFSATIPANDYYLFQFASGFLNNGGDDARLINNLGAQIDIYSFTSITSAYSWSKQPGGTWCQALPSQGIANNPCLGITPTPTLSPSVGGDGGGGGNPGAPTCTDPVPGTPSNLTALASGSSAILNWTDASSPHTGYLVAYGPLLGNYLYGNPNIGNFPNYIVNNLTPNAQYCFYVRAQNGCMPGARSNEVCINTGSVIPAVFNPPTGFQSGVLGAQTTETPTPSASILSIGQVEGIATNCSSRWLPLLYLLALAINHYYLSRQKELPAHDRSPLRFFFPFAFPILAFAVDQFILTKLCCYGPAWYCRHYWLGSLLALLLPLLSYWRRSPN